MLLFFAFGCSDLRARVVDAEHSTQAALVAVSELEDATRESAVDVEVRLRDLEGRIYALEAAQAVVLDAAAELGDIGARLDALEAGAVAAEEVAELRAEVAELRAEVGELREEVADVASRTSSGEGGAVPVVAAVSQAVGVASSSAWASVTTAGLSVEAGPDAQLLVWCVLLDNTGYAAYRVRAVADDGTWSAASEVVGDGAVTMAYTGESVAVVGSFTPPEGTITVTCEGWYGTPYDVSVVALSW